MPADPIAPTPPSRSPLSRASRWTVEGPSRADAGRQPFERSVRVPGWAASRWGYDGTLECFWAELVADGGEVVRIGPEHLLPSVPALARAVAFSADLGEDDAYLALTA